MARADQTPQDLLFGLLALQNGLIDQDQLVAAFSTWNRERGRLLADILVVRGAIDEEARSLLAAMAAKQLKLHGGDPERSLASLAIGPSTRHELAKVSDTDLTSSLAHIRDQTPNTDGDATETMSIGTSTSEGGRFRVLRPHARGGLGAVFVALDSELNREVAVKRILDHHADDPSSHQRFVLEAEITGGLEHPGIVPVYGLGHHADGRPYYAMRFIRGDSLKEAIEVFHRDDSPKADPGRRSLALRKLLRRFVDVCNAIEYAHGRGVLHRDIKPGNVIVGKHGETIVVDWGLAKPMGHAEPTAPEGERTLMPSSASGSAETLPGQAIGTPAYMSPEQASGDLEKLGPRSDVYSLGASLYALLTGRAPFEGDDLGEILRKVQRGDFPPPRRVDPSIDPALEAVCHKAMATDPAARYGSARSLADDIERWSADEPVSAWREPLLRRARRWARRNRALVTAASAAVLVAVAGLAAVLAVQTRANVALKAANGDLAVANAKVTRTNGDLAAANRRERARFDLAREAIRAFHTGVSEDILLRQDEFKVLRTRLLRGAAEFYRKLEVLLEGQKDRESRLALGRSYDEIGELTRKLGSITDAESAERRALTLFEDLAREDPADSDARLALAHCLKHLGSIDTGVGRRADAIAAFGRSRDLFRSLAEGRPDDRGLRDEWAHGELFYAGSLTSSGRSADGLESARRAVEILEARGKSSETPDPTGPRRLAMEIYGGLALALAQISHGGEECLAAYRRSCDAGEALHRADPDDPQVAHELARNLANMGLDLAAVGRHVEALAAFDRAGDLIRTARRTYPTLIILPSASAWIDVSAAWSLDALGRDDRALEALRRAKEAREALIKANPSMIRNRMQMCRVLGQTATILQRAGRMAEALESLGEARRIAAGLVEEHPEDRDSVDNLSYVEYLLVLQLLGAGRHAEALAEADRSLAAIRKWAGAGRWSEYLQNELPGLLRLRGIALGKLGRGVEAATDLRESIAMLRGIARPAPVDVYDIACGLSLLSSVESNPALADEAMAALRRAIDAGYRDAPHMKVDTDLDPIRGRPDFRSLMMDLAMPADAFASPRRPAP